MKFSTFLERQSLLSKSSEALKRNAIKWRKYFDRQKDKESKKKDRVEKSIQKSVIASDKKNINFDLHHHKSLVKDRESLKSLINKFESMKVDQDIIDLIKDISSQIDRNASKDNLGTRMISRNINAVKKLIDHPYLKKNEDPKIGILISKIVRISNPGLNPKSKNYNKLQEFYKSINNSLFNAVKDLVFELVKQNVFKQKGIK